MMVGPSRYRSSPTTRFLLLLSEKDPTFGSVKACEELLRVVKRKKIRKFAVLRNHNQHQTRRDACGRPTPQYRVALCPVGSFA